MDSSTKETDMEAALNHQEKQLHHSSALLPQRDITLSIIGEMIAQALPGD